MAINIDLEKSSFQLSEEEYLDRDSYTQVTSIVLGQLTEPQQTQLLSVSSELNGELVVFVDGEEKGPIFIGVGSTQIPFHSEYEKQFTVYFLPIQDTGNGQPISSVRVSVI